MAEVPPVSAAWSVSPRICSLYFAVKLRRFGTAVNSVEATLGVAIPGATDTTKAGTSGEHAKGVGRRNSDSRMPHSCWHGGIVPVLCPHNKREENVAIKAGEVPGDWENKPSKHSRKGLDARWTRKPGASHYGTRNEINVDRKHQLIRQYHVTDATHHSQAVDALLTRGTTGSGVWAGTAWRSAGIGAVLKARKLTSHIHRKGQRGKPLTGQARQSNRTKSSLRVLSASNQKRRRTALKTDKNRDALQMNCCN